MLSVVSHQVKTTYPRVLLRQFTDDVPAFIAAPIVDEDQFIMCGEARQYRFQPLAEARQRRMTVEDRNDLGKTVEFPGGRRLRARGFRVSQPCARLLHLVHHLKTGRRVTAIRPLN